MKRALADVLGVVLMVAVVGTISFVPAACDQLLVTVSR